MKKDRCAINFEIFLLDILSCHGGFHDLIRFQRGGRTSFFRNSTHMQSN